MWRAGEQCAFNLFFVVFHRLQYFARGLQVYIRQLRVALQGKTGDALKTEEVWFYIFYSDLCFVEVIEIKVFLFIFYLQFQGLYLSDLSNAFQKTLEKYDERCHMCSNFISSQNKIKVVALKITNNINVLIKVTFMNSDKFWKSLLLCQILISFLFFYLLQDLFHNPPSYKSTVTLSWKPVQKTEAAAIGYVNRSTWTFRSPCFICLLTFLPWSLCILQPEEAVRRGHRGNSGDKEASHKSAQEGRPTNIQSAQWEIQRQHWELLLRWLS